MIQSNEETWHCRKIMFSLLEKPSGILLGFISGSFRSPFEASTGIRIGRNAVSKIATHVWSLPMRGLKSDYYISHSNVCFPRPDNAPCTAMLRERSRKQPCSTRTRKAGWQINLKCFDRQRTSSTASKKGHVREQPGASCLQQSSLATEQGSWSEVSSRLLLRIHVCKKKVHSKTISWNGKEIVDGERVFGTEHTGGATGKNKCISRKFPICSIFPSTNFACSISKARVNHMLEKIAPMSAIDHKITRNYIVVSKLRTRASPR